LVEDDPCQRETLAEIAQEAGLDPRTYASGDEFLEDYESDTPGCAVLDVRLPGRSGVAIQAELNDRGALIPLIAISGYASVATVVRVLQAGAFAFLEKPFALPELLETIRRALALDAAQRADIARIERYRARLGRLSHRERQIAQLMLEGTANKVIAITLGISEKTVEAHRASMLRKLGMASTGPWLYEHLCVARLLRRGDRLPCASRGRSWRARFGLPREADFDGQAERWLLDPATVRPTAQRSTPAQPDPQSTRESDGCKTGLRVCAPSAARRAAPYAGTRLL
jgi:FixJ family two-component response regulator